MEVVRQGRIVFKAFFLVHAAHIDGVGGSFKPPKGDQETIVTFCCLLSIRAGERILDADVARLIAARLDTQVQFEQDDWDKVLNRLRFGRLDFITGMEINTLRQKYFDFTTPYYARESVIFVLDDSAHNYIQTQEDLYGKVISGDRSSLIEQSWIASGIRSRFRIRQFESKAQSMQMLKQGKVEAAIMPLEVGMLLARDQQVGVRVLSAPRLGAPVALAVRKGNRALLQRLDGALQQLIAEGEIARIYQRRFATIPKMAAQTP